MKAWKALFFGALIAAASNAQITINPGDDIQSKINANPAGTTFIISSGLYRIASALGPKSNDSFVGSTACNPVSVPGACGAVISGSREIGSLAAYDSASGYYKVTGQTQQGQQSSTTHCISGYSGCIYPEDLFFDGKPYLHLYSSTLPVITSGQWWFDYANDTIWFKDNPAGHLVETSVATNAFIGPANNVTIQYLTVEEFAAPIQNGAIYPQYGSTSDAAKQTQGINWTIENCEIWGAHGNGISIQYGMQVLNSYVHDNGNLGISGGLGVSTSAPVPSCAGFVTNPFCTIIQGNTISKNNYSYVDPGFQGGGFKAGRSFNIALKNNTVSNNEGAGIHFDVSSYGGLVDGNVVTGNLDADGVVYEIGSTQAGNHPIIRNNVLRNNGNVTLVNEYPNYQLSSRTSQGVEAYCNLMEIPNAAHIHGFRVDAANRGTDSNYPGLQYTASGNYFHHNTVIWDSGATGQVGYALSDPTNQPNFFSVNTPPDQDTYHLSNISSSYFTYDNNSTGANTAKNFAAYKASGADVHGTLDTAYSSGFPTVSITSPQDQSTFANLFTVLSSASDAGGISKVEFYVDWNLAATLANPPYVFTWTSPVTAAHTVAAMAYSGAGVRACNAITLNMVGSADPGAFVF